MHRFTTSDGKQLWYNVNDNRISLLSKERNIGTCPVVHFSSHTNIKTDNITMFTIEMTQQCNLRCTYCCYSGNYRDRRAHNERKITIETLSQTAKFIINNYDKSAPEITICFYGGEALLARNEIEWLINELENVLAGKFVYSLSTNGVALTEKVIDWICSFPKFLVNITIDGNKVMHDRNRKTVNGRGSYDTIIKNLTLFKKKYPIKYDNNVRFLATVYSWNDVLELDRVWDSAPVLAGHYPVHISHIIPNFDDTSRIYDTWEIKNNFYSTAFKAYKDGKIGILSDCFKRLINIVRHRNYQPLMDNLKIKTCYQELYSCFINVCGDIYACEKFCGENAIGNVTKGINNEVACSHLEQFTSRKNHNCKSCWAQRLCRMCLTCLNFKDEEIGYMCNMERDTIDLALRYFCELKDWEHAKIKDNKNENNDFKHL